MDKIDIIGHESDYVNPKEMLHKKPINHLSSSKHFKQASEFVLFVRNQTKENDHLNLYSKDIQCQICDFRNLSSKILRFDKLNKEEIISILVKSIIRITNEIVVLNKPYGISVQDGKSQSISIVEMLEDLSKQINLTERLQVVHRLDRDTTGVLLLAKNSDVAFLLKEAFKKGQIRKNYLCLTHGLPHSNEGIIDFPLKEYNANGNFLIKPDMKHIHKSNTKESATNSICTGYKLLDSNYNIGLVQCVMLSGVKHQIRAHLAYGLETPVIGDHKYSWLINSDKFPILPQTLSPLALKGLQITAGKVRHLPIHLHAHQIIIGDVPILKSQFNGSVNLFPENSTGHPSRLQNLHVYANIPKFFEMSLKLLKLYNLNLLKGLIRNVL